MYVMVVYDSIFTPKCIKLCVHRFICSDRKADTDKFSLKSECVFFSFCKIISVNRFFNPDFT